MSLYNMTRPMNLSEIKGQDKTVSVLKSMLKNNQLPNALLLVGVRGTGKTSAARILGRYANCLHPTEDGPCNECEACKEALAESSMDIIELDAASNNGVDDVHELIKAATYVPYRKTKVFIVDEIHMLSTAAFNALLKTVEDNSSSVKFIFCTTEEHKVPATIKSRCVTLRFERIEEIDIYEQLKSVSDKYDIEYEEDALKMIARAADGSMRDSQSILEGFMHEKVTAERVSQGLGIATEDSVFDILMALGNGDAQMLLDSFYEVKKSGRTMKTLIRELIHACTEIIYLKKGGKARNLLATENYREKVESLKDMFTPDEMLSYIKAFTGVYGEAKFTSIEFAVEYTLLGLLNRTEKEVKAAEYEARITELETSLSALSLRLEEIEKNGVMVSASAPAESEEATEVDDVPAVEEIEAETPSETDDIAEQDDGADEADEALWQQYEERAGAIDMAPSLSLMGDGTADQTEMPALGGGGFEAIPDIEFRLGVPPTDEDGFSPIEDDSVPFDEEPPKEEEPEKEEEPAEKDLFGSNNDPFGSFFGGFGGGARLF